MKEKSIKVSPKHGVNPSLGLCPLCGKENGEIYLLGKLKGDAEAPRKACIRGGSPCDKCSEYMRMGFLIIVCKDGSEKDPYRTGQIYVVTLDAARRMFPSISENDRAAFVEESAALALGLNKSEEQLIAEQKEREK